MFLTSVNNFYNYSIQVYSETDPIDFVSFTGDRQSINSHITVAGITSDAPNTQSKLFYLIQSYDGNKIEPVVSPIFCLSKDEQFTYYTSNISDIFFENKSDGKLYLSLGSIINANINYPINLIGYNTNPVPISISNSSESSLFNSSSFSSLSDENNALNHIYTRDLFGDKVYLNDLSTEVLLYNSNYDVNKAEKLIYYSDNNIAITENSSTIICPSFTLIKVTEEYVLAKNINRNKLQTSISAILINNFNRTSYTLNDFEIINPISLSKSYTKDLKHPLTRYVFDYLKIDYINFAAKTDKYASIQLGYQAVAHKEIQIQVSECVSQCIFVIESMQNVFFNCNYNYKMVGGKHIYQINTYENKIFKVHSQDKFLIKSFFGKNV